MALFALKSSILPPGIHQDSTGLRRLEALSRFTITQPQVRVTQGLISIMPNTAGCTRVINEVLCFQCGRKVAYDYHVRTEKCDKDCLKKAPHPEIIQVERRYQTADPDTICSDQACQFWKLGK